MTGSLYTDLPGGSEGEEGVADPGWIRELLDRSGIPVGEEELPLIADVYREYERLMAAIDAIDLAPDTPPALTLDEMR